MTEANIQDSVTADVERDLRDALRLRGMAFLFPGLMHELRSPLNSMSLHLELLRRGLANGDGRAADGSDQQSSDQRMDWLEIVRTELGRLDRGLQTLYNQLEPVGEKSAQIDLQTLLADLESRLRIPAQHQQIELDIESECKDLWIQADRDDLLLAILAIVQNAFEAMPEGGCLRIRGRRVEDRCLLEIRDTGCGIPDADLPYIFDLRFSSKEGAAGIGLTLARSILDELGGSVEVASSTAGATVVRVGLPLAQA